MAVDPEQYANLDVSYDKDLLRVVIDKHGTEFELNRDAKQIIWDLLDVEVPIVTAVIAGGRQSG